MAKIGRFLPASFMNLRRLLPSAPDIHANMGERRGLVASRPVADYDQWQLSRSAFPKAVSRESTEAV